MSSPRKTRRGMFAAIGSAFALIATLGAGVTAAADDQSAPEEMAIAESVQGESPAEIEEAADPGAEPVIQRPAAEEPAAPVEAETPAPATVVAPDEPEKDSPEPIAPVIEEDVDALTEELDADESGDISLLAAGPDGGTPPLIHWNVVDEDTGELIPGATFKLERTTWLIWRNVGTVSDCVDTCSSFDQDADGGEFLVENRALPRDLTASGSSFRLTPDVPPEGFVWVDTSTIEYSNLGQDEVKDLGTFGVRALPPLQCDAGNIYAISDKGQIQQINPSGNVSNVGGTPSSITHMNGLGITRDGEIAYAFDRGRNGQTANIHMFDPRTETWANTGHSHPTNVTLVAGAVNMRTGNYAFGGFNGSGHFEVFEYNPATGQSTKKGTLNTAAPSPRNGDMAFDANGNLYVVSGSTNTARLYSVTAENYDSASGGTIAISSVPARNLSTVNGLAFDSDGRAYLGNGNSAYKYNMPDWSNETRVTQNINSTDLAGCGSPPTVTIEKVVQGGRVKDTDQFTMRLFQGQAEIGNTTTEGTATGVQEQRVGPVPAVRNTQLRFTESASGTTNLDEYATNWRCLVDGKQVSEGDGIEGSFKITAGGDEAVCTFWNSPLVTEVNISKEVVQRDGTVVPGQDWEVSAIPSDPTSGALTSEPTAETQLTNADGDASWTLRFSDKEATASLVVSETMQDGYTFESGTCTVTNLDGKETVTKLEGPEGETLEGVKPGDLVDCTFVNKHNPVGELAITKVIEESVPQLSEGFAFSGDYTCLLGEDIVASGEWTTAGGTAELTPNSDGVPANEIPADAICTVTETTPIGGLPTNEDGEEFYSWADPVYDTQDVTIVANETQTVTVRNSVTENPGSVTWSKVDSESEDVLGGSEWNLTGPTYPEGETVVDCVSDSADNCTGLDKDPAAGKFKVEGLNWGEYTLVETLAPAGYMTDSAEHTFTIGYVDESSTLTVGLGNIENTKVTPPSIPLTGGIGRDAFLFAGLGVLGLGLAVSGTSVVRRRD